MKPPPAALALLLLAACGSPAGNDGAGVNQADGGNQAAAPGRPANGAAPAAPGAGAADRLQAGQWELTGVLQSIDLPGMPADRVAAARAEIGRPSSNRVCMTEDQAQNFLRFVQRGQTSGCTVGEQVYAGGVVRARVSCAVPDGRGGRGGTFRMALQGTYTTTTFALTMSQEQPNPGAASGPPRRMSAAVRGRRLGACPAVAARPVPPPPTMRTPPGPPVLVQPRPPAPPAR